MENGVNLPEAGKITFDSILQSKEASDIRRKINLSYVPKSDFYEDMILFDLHNKDGAEAELFRRLMKQATEKMRGGGYFEVRYDTEVVFSKPGVRHGLYGKMNVR